MANPMQVVILEDLPDDAELVADELRDAGLEINWTRVDRRETFIAALASQPDLIVADFNVPEFGALDALDLLRELNSNIPVIVITGSIGDELAAECIKRGASDYLLKDRLSRLGTAAQVAMESRRLRARVEQTVQDSRRLAAIVEGSGDAIIGKNLDGIVTSWNSAAEQLFGYASAEMIGNSILRLIPPDRHQEEEHILSKIRGGESVALYSTERVRKDGEKILVSIRISPVRDGSGRITGASKIVRDVTASERTRQALVESEERFRQLAENIQDVFFLRNAQTGETLYISPAFERIWGVPGSTLIANPSLWLDSVHADDREQVRMQFDQGALKRRFEINYRIVRHDGAIRWIEMRGFPVNDHSGASLRIAGIAKDVSERHETRGTLHRLTRARAVMSGINTATARIRNPVELYREACRIAVEHGGVRVAIACIQKGSNNELQAVAGFGIDLEALGRVSGGAGADVLLECNGMSAAVEQRRPLVDNSILDNPNPSVVGREAIRRGCRSAMALPLMVDGKAIGALVLYSEQAGFFTESEVRLQSELTTAVSLALESMAKSDRLDFVATFDALTGLPNREVFAEQLAADLLARDGVELETVVILLDVQRFRQLCDSLGRQAGDQLLSQIADRLSQKNASVARVGADVFALTVAGLAFSSGNTSAIDDVINAGFSEPFELAGLALPMHCRAGVAIFPRDGSDAETLLRNADAALHFAKERNLPLAFYAPSMNARAREVFGIESRLRRALERNEFLLHFQPKVRLSDRRIVGAEALLRWNDPERGVIPPLDFIGLLEETGLIIDVGLWVIASALRERMNWELSGLVIPRVAVNVSAVQIQRHDFVARVMDELNQFPDGARHLELEVTETLLMHDVEESIRKLEALQQRGICIAMDDFGTGYSSLSYLSRLPVDIVKIDRSFIVDVLDSEKSLSIVTGIIALVHSLKRVVVAEGVETEAQAQLLAHRGCDEIQGYLSSRPLPADEFRQIVANQQSSLVARPA